MNDIYNKIYTDYLHLYAIYNQNIGIINKNIEDNYDNFRNIINKDLHKSLVKEKDKFEKHCKSLHDDIINNILFRKSEGVTRVDEVKNKDNLTDLVTIKQLITLNPAFTEGGIRALIFHEHRNGFNSCVRRIGRKILISRTSFLVWIEEQK